jgi:Protein of unknown function (DUF4231)
MDQPDAVLTYVDEQMSYYERAAGRAQKAFRIGRLITLITAAAIPICALLNFSPLLTAALGALIAVLEGTQQIFQFHENWLNYRSTAEALRRERLLYTSGAGPYAEAESAGRSAATLLAERVVALTTEEQAKWRTVAERAAVPGVKSPADTGEPVAPKA